jgi:hypothetical protein
VYNFFIFYDPNVSNSNQPVFPVPVFLIHKAVAVCQYILPGFAVTTPSGEFDPFSTSKSVSRSSTNLAVIVAAILYPAVIAIALVDSCARVIVNVSVEIPVTRTISALAAVGGVLGGQTVALNGVAGNKVPVPAATTKDVPLVVGEGAVATVDCAKFFLPSINLCN